MTGAWRVHDGYMTGAWRWHDGHMTVREWCVRVVCTCVYEWCVTNRFFFVTRFINAAKSSWKSWLCPSALQNIHTFLGKNSLGLPLSGNCFGIILHPLSVRSSVNITHTGYIDRGSSTPVVTALFVNRKIVFMQKLVSIGTRTSWLVPTSFQTQIVWQNFTKQS